MGSCCSGIACSICTFSVRDEEDKLHNRIKLAVEGAQNLFCDSSLICWLAGFEFKDRSRKVIMLDPFLFWSAGYFKKQ